MRGPFERRMSDVGVTSGLSPQMAGRPLHSGSSQGELRHKMMIPPELPLRRGASVDRVVDLPPPPNGATTLNSKSSSTATSRNYICFYLSIFWNYDYYFSKKNCFRLWTVECGTNDGTLPPPALIKLKIYCPGADIFSIIKCVETTTVEVYFYYDPLHWWTSIVPWWVFVTTILIVAHSELHEHRKVRRLYYNI